LSCEYIERTIKIKNESSTLSEKDICYEAFLLSKNDENLASRVNSVAQRFFASLNLEEQQEEEPEAPEITITIKMVWQS
jgi:hypothetical protein